ncbi:hypothetical protein ACQ1PF_07970 [Ornithobacterium rhinotracheale]
MTREILKQELKSLIKKREELNYEILKKAIEHIKFSDENQQYSESIVEIKSSKDSKKVLRGVITYKEDFLDGDTGDIVTIDRTEIVMEDGVWIHNLLDYALDVAES